MAFTQPCFRISTISSVLIFYLLLTTKTGICSITSISEDGGYHIVVAINPNTQLIPRNPVLYFQDMQDNLQIFSQQLANATQGTFYVKNVDVVVPWSWTGEIPSPIVMLYASTQSYETADIRLFENHLTASVENPNPCGFAGQYIELPLTFFDNSVPAKPNYGPMWKALVNQWARYRYGVWEEHGDPSSSQFPYFFRKPNGTSWLVTGCSDEPIAGNITNSQGAECDLNSKQEPSSDCRLRPIDDENSAKSSLMHLHWLESVTEFCDFDTHDGESPNRQNKYCGHHSVWEVIKKSLDYKAVTRKRDNGPVPNINFQLLVTTRRPLLYLLIDEGRTSVPEYVIQQVYGNLTKLFDEDVEDQVVASIGTYPAPLGSHQIVNERVHWQLIRDHREDFPNGLEASLREREDGQPIRNFGEALLQVIRDINERNSPAGGVILIVKTGAGENTFNQITPESEIIAALDERQNIIVHAVEMPTSEYKPYTNNLKRITEKTGGSHAVVSKSYHITRDLIPILNDINYYLSQPILFATSTHKQRKDEYYGFSLYRQEVVYKGFTERGLANTLTIPIHTSGLYSLQFYFTITESVEPDQIRLISSQHPETNILLEQSHDWNEENDYRRRRLYSFKTQLFTESNATWTFHYNCSGNLSVCRGFLLVYGQIPKLNSNDIDISLSTSAGDRILDMSLFSYPTFVPAPFSIFAKVTRNRKPIRNLQVEAVVQLLDGSHSSWKVPLLDDGFITPDLAEHDGIYSGTFVPNVDGPYKIYVRIRTPDLLPEDEQQQTISLPKLLPVDQEQIGCLPSENECKSIQLTEPINKVVTSKDPVIFVNTATYVKGIPYRITDLEIIANANFFITFQFTAPKLIGMEGRATQFNFYMSPRLKTLIGTGLGNLEIMITLGDEPGKKVSFRMAAMEEVTPYYCVEAMNGLELRSGSSNIFGIKTSLVGGNGSTTTTETTQVSTTTRRSTTSTYGTASTDSSNTTTADESSNAGGSNYPSHLISPVAFFIWAWAFPTV